MTDSPNAPLAVLTATTLTLEAGQLAYLVGASGSGKSQVLGALCRAWPGPVVAGTLGDDARLRTRRRPVLDVLGLPTQTTLRLLCQAGLAEPRLWLSPPRCLSAGQCDRLALARLYAAAERACGSAGAHVAPPVLLAIDEFGSRLDRLTAGVLAMNLRRWLSRSAGVAVVVATAHDDLADALAADQVWVKTCEGTIHIEFD